MFMLEREHVKRAQPLVMQLRPSLSDIEFITIMSLMINTPLCAWLLYA